MRAFPDAGRGKDVKPEQGEHDVCRNGFLENGIVLVVVVDDEHPHKNQRAEDAGENFRRGMNIPEGSGSAQKEQREGAECIKTAFPSHFHGKRPRCTYEFSARSHCEGPRPHIYEEICMEVIPGVCGPISDATRARLRMA